MVKDIIEKMADGIGFDIGTSCDETQAKLLNGFCRGLKNSMNDDKLDIQICYFVDKLTTDSHSVLKNVVEFIELKERRTKN